MAFGPGVFGKDCEKRARQIALGLKRWNGKDLGEGKRGETVGLEKLTENS